MNPIQQTVDIIDSRIQTLHTLRSQLLALDTFPSVQSAPSLPSSEAAAKTTEMAAFVRRNNNGSDLPKHWGKIEPHRARPRARAKNGSPPKHRKTEAPKHRSSRSSRADTHSLAIAAQLPEPFSAPDLAKAAKLDYKTASNRVTHWKAAKYLKRVAPGQYTRTAKFPDVNPVNQVNPVNPVKKSPEPPSDPTPAPTRIQLQVALDSALRLRDHCAASGQDTLAGIHQKKIDSLVEQIASFKQQ